MEGNVSFHGARTFAHPVIQVPAMNPS
jgi:hypothetical protein